MKLIIQNNDTYLIPDSIPLNKRLEVINELLKTKIQFDDYNCSIEEHFRNTWDKENTKVCLDMIGFYLSKKPNQNGSHDRYILNRDQEVEIKKGIYDGEIRYKNFSDTSIQDQLKFGFRDFEDESERQKRINREV